MKKPVSIIPSKEHSLSPELEPDLKVYEMSLIQLKIIIIRKLKTMQENTGIQLKEMGKTIGDIHKTFTKEIEIVKKNQIEILKIKFSVNEIKKYS